MKNLKIMKIFICCLSVMCVLGLLSVKITFSNTSNQVVTADNIMNICYISDTWIDCGYRNIKQIDDNAFDNYSNITNLYLYGNQIESLPDLSSLTNLSYLNISDNKISNISVINNLTALTSLTASRNKIESLPDLSNLTNLQSLDL